LRGLGRARADRRRARRARARARLIRPARTFGARAPCPQGERDLRVPGRISGALLREAPLQLRPARASRLLHIPREGWGCRPARPRSRAALRARGGRRLTIAVERVPAVDDVLERALDGERITDDDAVALLRSRDLVAVGRAANEIRRRLNDPSRVTFI